MTAASPALPRGAASPTLSGRARRFAYSATPPLVALAIAIAIWEAVVAVARLPVYLLPAPSAVVGTLWSLLKTGFVPPQYLGAPAEGILYHTYITFVEAGVGLLIGVLLGIVLAVVMV